MRWCDFVHNLHVYMVHEILFVPMGSLHRRKEDILCEKKALFPGCNNDRSPQFDVSDDCRNDVRQSVPVNRFKESPDGVYPGSVRDIFLFLPHVGAYENFGPVCSDNQRYGYKVSP